MAASRFNDSYETSSRYFISTVSPLQSYYFRIKTVEI